MTHAFAISEILRQSGFLSSKIYNTIEPVFGWEFNSAADQTEQKRSNVVGTDRF